MNSVGEKGSRLLDDAAQICDLLRLAHSAIHRMQQELHGSSYDQAMNLSQQLHQMRVECNELYDCVNRDVEQMEQNSEAI